MGGCTDISIDNSAVAIDNGCASRGTDWVYYSLLKVGKTYNAAGIGNYVGGVIKPNVNVT